MANEVNEQMEEQIKKDSSFNLKNIKDVTLSNGKRIIIMFKNNSMEPTVFEYDGKASVLDDVRQRQLNDPKYQGEDARYNAEEILDDIAKEGKAYQNIKPLDENYEISPIYDTDIEKLKKLAALIQKARQDNYTLPEDEKYAFIDEENEYIMTKTGKILEAKFDSLENKVIVQSPEDAAEFKDEELNEEKLTAGTDEIGDNEVTNLQDEDEKDDELEDVYNEVFIKGDSTLPKEQVMANLKKIAEDPNNLNNLPPEEQVWYQEALKKIEQKRLSKDHTKTLEYKKKQDKKNPDNEEGVSNYVYIALVVLLIAFAVFMYIIFRR